VRVHILGTRGSTPAPGIDFVHFGGHTSSLALAHDGAPPCLVLDAGTGIRRLSRVLGGSAYRGSILLGHLHWDHTQGIPFFNAGDAQGSSITLMAPWQDDTDDIEEVLSRAMSPPHFPITPGQLRGSWRFAPVREGEHQIEGFNVRALEIPHKGGRTLGYRVSDGRGSLAYMSDHWPTGIGPGPEGLGEYHANALSLAENVDALFHDAQYLDEELPARGYFGHSCPGYAINLAVRAGARKVMLFHHDPDRTDAEIDAIVGRYQGAKLPVEAAREGAVVDLP